VQFVGLFLSILILHNKTLHIPFSKYYDDEIKEDEIGHLKTTCQLLYLKTQFVPRSKHFHLGYKSQSVYVVWGRSRCLFSAKCMTHKYTYIQCGQSVHLLNVKPVGASLNQ